MRMFRFDRIAGIPLERFGSSGVTLVRGVRAPAAAQLGFFYYDPASVLGAHPAVGGQLLCVVDGDGWVSGGDGVRHPIARGQAAYFTDGEQHASGSEAGMAAVVFEATDLEPDKFMAELPLSPAAGTVSSAGASVTADDQGAADVADEVIEEFSLVAYRVGDEPARRAFRRAGATEADTVLESTPARDLRGVFFFCEFPGGRHAAESTEEILARVEAGEAVRVIRGPYSTRADADQGMGELLG